MTTLRDIAKRCGCSLGTVSNVLNGKAESLDPSIRDRILAAMRDLEYRPAPAVPKRSRLRSRNFGVILNDIVDAPLESHGYYAPVIDGIFRAAGGQRWSVTFHTRQMFEPDAHRGLRQLCDGRSDGLLVVAPEPNDSIVSALIERGTPFVVVNGYQDDPRVSCVDVHDEHGARLAVEFLLEHGHQRIAYVNAGFLTHSDRAREQAYRKTLEEAGIPHENQMVIPGGNVAGRYTDVADWFVGQPPEHRPTALFCWNDELALGLLRQLTLRGIDVPKDVSIVGFDGTWESQKAPKAITTIRQPLREIGQQSVRLLIDHVEARTPIPEKLVLRPEIQRGETVSYPPGYTPGDRSHS